MKQLSRGRKATVDTVTQRPASDLAREIVSASTLPGRDSESPYKDLAGMARFMGDNVFYGVWLQVNEAPSLHLHYGLPLALPTLNVCAVAGGRKLAGDLIEIHSEPEGHCGS